ncbi:CaCA family Na(+)/Ca(+) antiporter [Nitratireductor aquibiodomus RA22]|uniref:CaCA family Na(+)/Ca(+) antiporter n=1 Tax=Nitratireductor aquibiodomus RA22 TaxID=1189611 RepID=I5C3B2_9HYPH|nr:CaCA family Na(+)/Ca(+) antiporter [Nitratireductor aquibiodomus RA22]
MLFSLLILAAGVILLVLAGDIFVKGAVGLAENLGISPLIIGLTVVAFGTSAPELFTSIQAALSGAPGLAVGNVVGSNIANILLVLGLPAIIYPIVSDGKGLRRNLVAMLVSTVIFMWMLTGGIITRIEGAVLFAGLCAFIAWQARDAVNGKAPADHDFHEEIGEAPHDRKRISTYLIAGVIGLPRLSPADRGRCRQDRREFWRERCRHRSDDRCHRHLASRARHEPGGCIEAPFHRCAGQYRGIEHL